jgi:hypothetical protein
MTDKKSENNTLQDFINSETYKQQEELIEESRKTVKSGNNVIHLTHLGELNNDDLNEINNLLTKDKLVLSSYNRSGMMEASLEDFALNTFLVLSQPIVIELLKGVGTNAIWDSIKITALFIRNKIKGKNYLKVTSGGNEEKEIKVGIQVNLDKNTGFNFELQGNLDNEIIENSLDKILDFIREQQPRKTYQIPDYVYYSEQKQKWIKIDVMDAIREKANKQRKNNK